MNEKELREKYTPRKCDSKVELDSIITEINADAYNKDHELLNKDIELLSLRSNLLRDKRETERQIDEINLERAKVDSERRAQRRFFQELKREFIVLNSKGFQQKENSESAK